MSIIEANKIVLFPFVGDTMGGSHFSALTLIDELIVSDYKVIILLYKRGVFSNYLDEKGYDYFLNDDLFMYPKGSVFKNPIKFLRANLKSYSYLKKNKINIVHTNDIRMHLSWCLAAFFCCKHIWHQRNISGSTMYFSMLSNKLITISYFCKDSFPRIIQNRAIVIKNPISIDYNELHSASKVTSGKIKIVWVANLVRNKRLIDALYIVAKLKGSGYQVLLNVLGDTREPIYSEARKKIEELGITDNVRFIGFSKNVIAWIKDSDCLLATAENEGLGRVLVEAMLLGTPVVASADGGHLEVVTDGFSGLLVPLGDIDGFCSAILKLKYDLFLKSNLTNNARLHALNEYSSQVHKDNVVRLYNDN